MIFLKNKTFLENKKEHDYHKKNFDNKRTPNIDLKSDLAEEVSRIQNKRKNNSIEEASHISHHKTNFYNNESEESNVFDMKAYYESNFNQNSLVGYKEFESQKNIKNDEFNDLNIIENRNLHLKSSNHDYLNLNGKPNLNLNVKNKNNKIKKEKSAKRKKWDNTKALLFPLTRDKNKVEYSPPSSFSRSRSVSRSSLSNKNTDEGNSRTNSANWLSKEEAEEIQKAKKSYKQNFLSTHKISDPDFVPGKRLYEQYQKKQPQKQEHHKQIKDSRLASEVKEATFSPQIDRNSKRIFKRSQEKNKNKDNSFISRSNNNNTDNTYNNFNSFSNTKVNEKANSNFSLNNNGNKNNKTSDRVENRLLDYGRNAKDKLLRENTKKNIREDVNYSFHPHISEKSQIIASIKKKERLEKAKKSFILNNTNKDELLGDDDYSDENMSNENEELSNNEKNNKNATAKKSNKNNKKKDDENYKYKKSKNINYSSNDSLMNSQENFSQNEKSYKNKLNNNFNKDCLSQRSGNTNKIKINSKNKSHTNRTNQSNVESENTFFNMRVSPKNKNKFNNNVKNKNVDSKVNKGSNSMRNLSSNSKKKSIDKNFSKGKNIRNSIYNSLISKSKSKSKSKDKRFAAAKYIPLNKNLKKKKNTPFANNESYFNHQSKADKDSNYSGDDKNNRSRTPTKTLRKNSFQLTSFQIKN